jgi:uncharacterized damage-inducible protein DinB
MDARTFIQLQMDNVHGQVDIVMKDLTYDQFNWLPPGTISPISAILLHLLAGEDFFIQGIMQGKPGCWDEQGWLGKIGIQAPGGPVNNWEVFKTTRVAIAPVLAYGLAVRAATDAYLSALTADELDRQVNFVGRMLPVGEVLTILMNHITCHAGEISAVKGMQGLKGLPF